MDRESRLILLLGVLALVVVALLYYFLLLSPLRASYTQAREERAALEQQRDGVNQQVAQLEAIRADAPNIQRRILEYSKRLPESDEIDTLVVQVEEVSRLAGVTQLTITPESPEASPNGGDFSRIPVTMSFEGNFNDMQDFLFRLKNLSRLVTVNEVSYEELEALAEEGATTGGADGAAAEATGENLLSVTITAETYVQPAAGGAAVTPPPTAPGQAPTGGTTAPAGGTTTPSTPPAGVVAPVVGGAVSAAVAPGGGR